MPFLKLKEQYFLSPESPLSDFPAITVWRITESEEELLNSLPEEKRYGEEASRLFRAGIRRREWLAVRVMLHRLLGEKVSIGYRANGSPYLLGSPLFISISHTKNYAALALHTRSVGIDIESPGGQALRLVDKFLSAEEQRFLFNEDAEERAVEAWSAKEAAFKFFGTGNPDLLNGITLREENNTLLLATDTLTAATASVRVFRRADFVLTLALPSGFSA